MPDVPTPRRLAGSDEALQQAEALRLANEYRPTMPPEVMKLWAADVVAELRRLHALTAQDGWLPIESAPQNERESVLVSDGQAVGEAFWHDGSQCYGHRGKAGWFWEADRDSLLTASNAHVTHYRPLPAPPADGKEAGEP